MAKQIKFASKKSVSIVKKKVSGIEIVRRLFLDNLGKIVTKEQIIEASRIGTGASDYENWHQRLSELRTDEGYTILSGRDQRDLRAGQYIMPTAERRPIASRRVKPTRETWSHVLRRAQNRCEWSDDGARCDLLEGTIDPIGGGTVRLTPDHMQPHSVDPNSDPADPAQWQALCGRHQVTKRNYWNSMTGKLNVVAIVQAASEAEKRKVLELLLNYYGLSLDLIGNIAKL
jgi:hypothetical protein